MRRSIASFTDDQPVRRKRRSIAERRSPRAIVTMATDDDNESTKILKPKDARPPVESGSVGASKRMEMNASCEGVDGERLVVLTVSCGPNEGRLRLNDLRGGSRGACVLVNGSWMTANEFQAVSGRGNAKDWKRSIKHNGRPLKFLLEQGLLSINPPFCLCSTCDSQNRQENPTEVDYTPRHHRTTENKAQEPETGNTRRNRKAVRSTRQLESGKKSMRGTRPRSGSIGEEAGRNRCGGRPAGKGEIRGLPGRRVRGRRFEGKVSASLARDMTTTDEGRRQEEQPGECSVNGCHGDDDDDDDSETIIDGGEFFSDDEKETAGGFTDAKATAEIVADVGRSKEAGPDPKMSKMEDEMKAVESQQQQQQQQQQLEKEWKRKATASCKTGRIKTDNEREESTIGTLETSQIGNHCADSALISFDCLMPESGLRTSSERDCEIEIETKRRKTPEPIGEEISGKNFEKTKDKDDLKATETILIVPNYVGFRREEQGLTSLKPGDPVPVGVDPGTRLKHKKPGVSHRRHPSTPAAAAAGDNAAALGRSAVQARGRGRRSVASKVADSTTKCDVRMETATADAVDGNRRSEGQGQPEASIASRPSETTSRQAFPICQTGNGTGNESICSSSARPTTEGACVAGNGSRKRAKGGINPDDDATMSVSRMRRNAPEVTYSAVKRRTRRQRNGIVSSTTSGFPTTSGLSSSDLQAMTSLTLQHHLQSITSSNRPDCRPIRREMYCARDSDAQPPLVGANSGKPVVMDEPHFRRKWCNGETELSRDLRLARAPLCVPVAPEIYGIEAVMSGHKTPKTEYERTGDVRQGETVPPDGASIEAETAAIYDSCGALDLTLRKNSSIV